MDDKFRRSLEAAVNAAVARNLAQAIDGKKLSGVGRDIADSMSEVMTAPVSAMKKTDIGPVMLLDKSKLLDRTAADLRSDDVIIPNNIPNYAVVVRDPNGFLVFAWKPIEVSVDEQEIDWRHT